jgi:cell division protein ZapB
LVLNAAVSVVTSALFEPSAQLTASVLPSIVISWRRVNIIMADSDIAKLEKRIDELIEICDKLKNENTLLRDRQEILVEERARLIEKAEMARVRVESMLVRLKAMEQET